MKRILLIPVFLVLTTSVAAAQAPPLLPVQGRLTDSNGVPVTVATDMVFTLYTDAAGTTSVWTETQNVSFDEGVFTVYLGTVTPIDTAAFRDNTGVWLGVQVGTDAEMPLYQLGSVPFAGWADYCGDADTLEGRDFATVTSDVLGAATTAGFLTSETDPAYTASPAAGIAGTDVSNWNTAYAWGDHTSAGYLTSYTETDPLFSASASAGIAGGDISNWNSAYGWGDHASAGYLTSYSETDPTVNSLGKATLSCAVGSVARRGATGWVCSDADAAAIAAVTGQVTMPFVGTVQAGGDFTYGAAKTYARVVSPPEFRPAFVSVAADYRTYDFTGAYGYPTRVGTVYTVAPVHLPHGASVTEVRCYWYDTAAAPNDFTSLSFSLIRKTLTSTATNTLASGSAVGLAGHDDNVVQSWADTTISNGVINNNLYYYYFNVNMNSNDATPCTSSCSQRFYGCKVDYTMTTVAP